MITYSRWMREDRGDDRSIWDITGWALYRWEWSSMCTGHVGWASSGNSVRLYRPWGKAFK